MCVCVCVCTCRRLAIDMIAPDRGQRVTWIAAAAAAKSVVGEWAVEMLGAGADGTMEEEDQCDSHAMRQSGKLSANHK